MLAGVMWRLGALLGVTLALAACLPDAAPARASYCSPSGDICYGAFGKGTKTRLRIALFARYFTRFRLCVTGPDGSTDCKRFRMRRGQRGMYLSSVRWAAHFPFRGAGRYRARWDWGAGLSRRIDFAAGPSIHVRPARVRAGQRLLIFGLAGGCPEGDRVTLLSQAFPPTNEFAGVPAVFARVDSQDSYRKTVRIPATRQPGVYEISGRCGGANFGVSRSLRVHAG